MQRILAIDYGLKRIGIAVTDPEQKIAQPLTTVESKNIFTFLKNYLTKESVEKIIIGLPLDLNSKENLMTNEVKKFNKAIRKKFPTVHTELRDERFTSKLAFQSMIDGGMKKKERMNKMNVDKISACILLQDYLIGQKK